jgi:hypothetical protein
MVESDLKRVTRAYDRTQRTQAELQKARHELHEAMRRARNAGASYAAIGRAAGGIIRQRVAEILGE